jgi:hypothetical protein
MTLQDHRVKIADDIHKGRPGHHGPVGVRGENSTRCENRQERHQVAELGLPGLEGEVVESRTGAVVDLPSGTAPYKPVSTGHSRSLKLVWLSRRQG